MQCPNDKHNFVQINEHTAGTMYKCDKCGLETYELTLPKTKSVFFETIYEKYFGSYIGGVSHVWDYPNMRAEDIVSFSVEFGNCPIVNVRYDGSVIKVNNSINGSRDGWMSFPEGYFDENTINLSDEDKCKLKECLKTLKFDLFITDPEIFRCFGSDGFCVNEKFSCVFSNGRGFECLFPETEEFTKLVSVVKDVLGRKCDIIDSDPADATTLGVIVTCCNKEIPDFYKYCPYCGKQIEDRTKRQKMLYDIQETLWLCGECGSGNRFEYKFCGNCGEHRPW